MKTLITRFSLSTILVCLAASTQAQPRASGGGLAERFKQLDRNGDGKISREEGGSLPFFDAADKNKDGFLTVEEVQAYFDARRTARPAAQQPAQTGTTPSAPAKSTGELTAVDAVFELCVRDVEACSKFYRDGIGMREVEPGALLEWAGSYLRLRKVPGEKPAPATGNPMKQMLSQNGFRWFSLWFNDPAAVSDRLVKAGYPAPVKGANVSMTRDPDGNVVELMRVPRSASGETFTWGMAVSDDEAARKFYGETLVYRWTEYDLTVWDDEQRMIRGLTAVPDPNGTGREVLIGFRFFPEPIVERIDPQRGHQATVELNLKDFFGRAFHGGGRYTGVIRCAYNPFAAVADPRTGKQVHLAGLQIYHPGFPNPPFNGSHYLIRRLDGTYDWAPVFDPGHPVPAGRSLDATRRICLSPFAEDEGRVLYFCGYDGPYVDNLTAWIYRAALPTTSSSPLNSKP